MTILTGPIGGGKTTLLRRVVSRLSERRIPFDGYLSARILEGGELRGYDLEDLLTGGRRPLLRRAGPSDWIPVGQFAMDPAGLAAAERIIGRSLPADLLIVDELGRLELEGRGIWPAARPVLADPRRNVLVVIREGLIASYRQRWAAEGIRVEIVSVKESGDADSILGTLMAADAGPVEGPHP